MTNSYESPGATYDEPPPLTEYVGFWLRLVAGANRAGTTSWPAQWSLNVELIQGPKHEDTLKVIH